MPKSILDLISERYRVSRMGRLAPQSVFERVLMRFRVLLHFVLRAFIWEVG